MNIYFLVEGRRTEKKVYPKWLSILIPALKEIKNPFEVDSNNYYLFNGNGFPSLLDNHLRNAFEDVNQILKFNYFVICLDSDDDSVEERKEQVIAFMANNKLTLISCEIIIIVQNKCIETWFLGNKNVYSRQPHSQKLLAFNNFYNVRINDPELMGVYGEYDTTSQFHQVYLSEMLLEKNIRYTKKNPSGVVEEYYLNELINRAMNTNHLSSFKTFIDFCKNINSRIH